MNDVKKRSFPIVLLVMTLILALLFTGFSYPGFLLSLFTNNEGSVKISKEGKDFAEGKSKAFSIEPTEGVTISAEENALDKDRKFKMEEISAEEYERVEKSYEETFPDDEGMVLKTWELDAGLKDDELLPGTFRMDFDLEALGVAKEDYEALSFYRVDDEGNWYEFASGIEGNTLSVESNQNSLVVAVLIIAAITPVAQDYALLFGSSGYFFPTIRREISKFYVKVDNKERFQLVCKLPELNMLLTDVQKRGKEIREKIQERITLEVLPEVVKSSSLSEEQKKKVLSETPESITPTIYGVYTFLKKCCGNDQDDPSSYRKVAEEIIKQQRSRYWKQLYNDNGWKAYMNEIKELNNTSESFEDAKKRLNQLDVVSKHLVTAYKYLRDDLGLQVPVYVIQVQLIPKIEGASAYATTNQPNLGNPYVVVDMSKVKDGGDTANDELLLTLTHELFHAVQRLYILKARSNFGFEECSAMALEWDAFEDYSKKENPETHKKYVTTGVGSHLENLKDVNFYAIPLDEYKADYPEGTIGYAMTSRENLGKRADVSYPKASFFKYLKKKYPVNWPDVMKRYKSLWGHRAMSTIFREVFQKDGKALYMFQLSDDFKEYVNSDQDRFLEAAKAAPEVAPKKKNKDDNVDLGEGGWIFAPIAKVGSTKADIRLANYDLTARVRRVKIEHKNPGDKEYSLVLKREAGYWDNLHDLDIDPLGELDYGEDFLFWNDGERGGGTYFFQPKPFPKEIDKPVLYLLELDGAGGKVNADAGGYSIYILTPVDEPEMEREDDTLIVKPFKPDDYKKDIVGSITVTFTYEKTELAIVEIPYKDWAEPWSFDLTELKFKGKELSQEMLSKVKVSFRECVQGTFDVEDPDDRCLGPALTLPLPVGSNIEGTWDLDVEVAYDSKILGTFIDGYMNAVDMYGQMYGQDSIKDVTDLGKMYGEGKTVKSKANMIVKPKSTKDGYEVTFKYNTGAPDETFDGTYDPRTMKLALKPRKKTTTGSDGVTYDYAQFGLQSDINIQVAKEKDDTGKLKLTLTGESANDPNNPIVAYMIKLSGTKVSDKYE